jgi:hypothetical protein
MVAYPQTSEPLIEFECGNSATELIRGSHSRFFVPEKELDSRTALAMKHGPWPIGTASEYFSEQWWLSNAIWQMLAREHGEWKDRLKLRIASFDSCGPP